MESIRIATASRHRVCFAVVLIVIAAVSNGANGQSRSEALPASDLWSLQPVKLQEVPHINDAKVANAIDAFVIDKLRVAGLALSPRADRRMQIRRAFFKLHGLSPNARQFAKYASDDRDDWYERMIDDLLASPRYGERWARHWLDLARFAETTGFETNQPRPHAWHYRDYVIDAFNRDTPYDRFIVEQLAGDATGAPRGTGFLVAGPYDTVKSPDVVLTRTQRSNELADMINATSTAFLGLTVACARCHDHKFDPVSQKDYYAMEAVFAGVAHGDRTIQPKSKDVDPATIDAMRKELAEFEERLIDDQIRAAPIAVPALPENHPANPRPAVHTAFNVDRFNPVDARFVRFTVTATNNGIEPCIDELEVFAARDAGDGFVNAALASRGAKATASSEYEGNPKHKTAHLNDGAYSNDRSWISRSQGSGWAMIELPEVRTVSAVMWARDRAQVYHDRIPVEYRIEVAVEPGDWRLVADSSDRRPYAGKKPFVLAGTIAGADKTHRDAEDLIARITELREAINKATTGVRAYVGTFAQPGPTHLLYRGDVMARREQVVADIPKSFGSLELKTDTPEQQRRLALANWMGGKDNPLTARVMVNRIWQHHFGRGLVATPSDFGHNGAKPSHPELLDYLAAEFVASGWSVKHMQKLIMTSNVYRQRSTPRAGALRVDASARLLWRYPPHRHEAEVIRDGVLHASGKLDLKTGGPGFSAFKANNNYVRVYEPKETFGPVDWRRMVYMTGTRMEQDATFGAFDCPDGGQVAPDRPRSTTALQALNLLNSPFVLQQADFLAERLKEEAGDDPQAQVQRAFAIVFNRPPSKKEMMSSVAFIKAQGLPSFCRAIFNVNEFLFVN